MHSSPKITGWKRQTDVKIIFYTIEKECQNHENNDQRFYHKNQTAVDDSLVFISVCCLCFVLPIIIHKCFCLFGQILSTL